MSVSICQCVSVYRGGVTLKDSIVTAVTAHLDLYTKEGVESLHILPYTPVNVHIVNSQWLKFNGVKGQSLKLGVVSSQMLVKVLICGHIGDYRVYGTLI